MRDGPVRRGIKATARAYWTIDLAATRLVWRLRGRKRYRLAGDCGGCASCCEAPTIQVSRITWYFPTIRRAFLWWQRVVNGFELIERDRQARAFVFRCTHFDWQTRRCDSYASRPGMCRDYPRALLYQFYPRFFEGCSYRPVALDGRGLIDEMKRQGVDADRIAEVRSRLYLDD